MDSRNLRQNFTPAYIFGSFMPRKFNRNNDTELLSNKSVSGIHKVLFAVTWHLVIVTVPWQPLIRVVQPAAHVAHKAISCGLLKKYNGPNVKLSNYEIKWLKILTFLFNFSKCHFFFCQLHCGRDSLLATDLWTIRKLIWQYEARG